MNTGKKTVAWFFEDPLDLEYKRYKLLANVEQAESMLESGDIHKAMDFIEDHLVCFYKFQTDQEINQMGDEIEILGIDPIMMDLIYKRKAKDNQDDLKLLSTIAEMGILEFEALHSYFRILWRNIDDSISLSHIPEKSWPISDGSIILVNPEDNYIRRYDFKNPEGLKDWKEFNISFQKEIEYEEGKIIEITEKISNSKNKKIILLASVKTSVDSINALEYVVACKVYYRLQKDYLF